ncbi:hypothetical protein [Streptomyces clavuligerus]|uniref:Secreted protein n=1 Tax=Streptomyces clavuligerus TaxID=1901 RepID=B5GLM0_STRCL|nr:hypothetical protein [Streptomyces clavuligerus]EDY47216.1 hypothetical protein SSCG_00244 [Streptomyces clavuligerus]EFG04883.1 Hypothetical protein SCLAV_p1401 [Streptomyces clavuligerus]MBY6306678.1 hypothetical protein [Streptomyces clavuligerus]QCS10715.1 hypothetical protein CRV15_34920 [Streptomyces clavuligerus]QPJ97249.1 hypothetical protein GE265_29555 [Streptomyces clavuligerus]
MRIKALAIAAMAAGTLATAAAPASAVANWQPVDTTPTWECSRERVHQVSNNIKFKVCTIRNANNDAQGVLVVQHSGTAPAVISGEVVTNFGSNTACAGSQLNAGFTRGCFAPTVHVGSGGTLAINARLRVNGVDQWYI